MKLLFSCILILFLGLNTFAKTEKKPHVIKSLESLLAQHHAPSYTPSKEKSVPNAVKSDYCLQDFLDINNVKEKIAAHFKKALLKKDLSGLKKINLLSKIKNFGPSKKPFRKKDKIFEYNWDKDQTFSQYIQSFSSIKYVDIQTSNFQSGSSDRDKKSRITRSSLKLKFDIRGMSGKEKRHDLYEISLTLKKKENEWIISSPRLEAGKTILSQRTPYFQEVTKTSGLSVIPTYLRTEAIRRGGYALSVTDLNGDKLPDIFVGLRDETIAFVAKKTGGYKRFQTGLEKEKYVKTAVFADFDNDGDQDVIINRFLESPKGNFSPDLDVVYYKNTGKGRFVASKKQIGGQKFAKEPMPAAVADFNNDGFLDFYVGYPGTRDFSAFYEPHDKKKMVQGLYLNDKNGGFQDFTDNLDYNKHGKKGYDLKLFPHSSLAIDFDQDHDMDLLVIDDRGNLSPVYQNLGNGKMKQSAKAIGIQNYGYGMSITSGDLNNDGITDLAITNVNLSDIASIQTSCSTNWKHSTSRPSLAKGLTAYSGSSKKIFTEVSALMDLDNPGEATGGLTFFDYNNDGLEDIYVVNGLWSGSKNGQDLSALFASIDFNKQFDLRYLLNQRDHFKFMDLLSKHTGRFKDLRNLKNIKQDGTHPSLGGYQRNRLYRNNGDGTFTDVAYFENIDSIADGYIAGKIDIDNDGRLDLILRNADPGTNKYNYPAVQLFHNKAPKKGFVHLTFEGRQSNKDAIGLYAIADFGDHKQVQHLEGNSGSMQQQRGLHFGLGKYKEIKNLEIHWPNGQVISKSSLRAGTYHIKQKVKKGLLSNL